jgi:predicted transcriptional regulator
MTRTTRLMGAVLGAVLVVGVTTIWIGSVTEAVVWVVGTAGANAVIQHGGVSFSCSGVSTLVPTGTGMIKSLVCGWAGKLFVFCGYSRYDGSDPLDHETRERIYGAVTADPGLFLSELAERLDTSLSTVRHHVRVLEDESLLTSEKINGKRRYYPISIEDPQLVAALGESATASVLDTLSRLGPASGTELADALDRDPSTVSHHLSRLADAGLIEREQRGRMVVSRLSARTRTALTST